VLAQFATCSATVGALTALYTHFLHVNPTTVALTLLVVVLVVAAAWGLKYSVFTSLIATACFNFFFLPPVRTWTIADPQNWVALAVFLITAMIASHLSDKARRQTKSAESRRQEIERLYAFSQQLLTKENVFELLNELPKKIVDEFAVTSAAIFLSSGQKIYHSDVNAHNLLSADELKAVSSRGEITARPEDGVVFTPLRIGVKSVGSFGIIGNLSRQTLEAIGSLVAIATERAGAVEKLSHAEAARENERLRSALLDAVAHEFRTPLTSIKAAASTLSLKVHLDDTQRHDLIVVVEEEADRLNRLVGEAAEMAQLDAHQVHLEFDLLDIRTVIGSVLKEPGLVREDRKIELQPTPDLPRVRVDKQRMAEVIRHLLENALKYSPPGSPIHITAERAGECVQVSVADQGPGIDDFEQALIFEKFYRGRGHRGVQGTGMGLPIAKAIIEAHGGTITVTSQCGRGSVFQFSLPALVG
jgi:two-component system, OmpR family, sensor histidine kinase KdpD